MAGLILKSPDEIRERVVVFLAFLTSEACRAACAPQLHPEQVTFELCRLWFDEIYTPSERYFDSHKAYLDPDATAAFGAAFSDEELKDLARFHGFLDLRMDMLRSHYKRRGTFPENDMWRNIVRDAAYLLETLEPDPDRLRRLLEAITHQAALGEAPLLGGRSARLQLRSGAP